jgi:hypothetical protein
VRSVAEIRERWQARLVEWKRLHVQVDGAALAGEIVADLERISENEGGDELTLTAASNLSGYSTDHLSRLIREGSLPNAGRKGAPRIRRVDLPIRPRSHPKSPVAASNGKPYDPSTDARSLRVRR